MLNSVPGDFLEKLMKTPLTSVVFPLKNKLLPKLLKKMELYLLNLNLTVLLVLLSLVWLLMIKTLFLIILLNKVNYKAMFSVSIYNNMMDKMILKSLLVVLMNLYILEKLTIIK
mmetsp:Transcript_18612/g.1641  ORF Transcript_18612/g.1641 Transcript_18612/m.1641 type:complete len:114 (+) Transcript_18612:627-968(+)